MQVNITPKRKFDETGSPAIDYHMNQEYGTEISLKPDNFEDEEILNKIHRNLGRTLTENQVNPKNKAVIEKILGCAGYNTLDNATIHIGGGSVNNEERWVDYRVAVKGRV